MPVETFNLTSPSNAGAPARIDFPNNISEISVTVDGTDDVIFTFDKDVKGGEPVVKSGEVLSLGTSAPINVRFISFRTNAAATSAIRIWAVTPF